MSKPHHLSTRLVVQLRPGHRPRQIDDVRAFVNELSAAILASERATHAGLAGSNN
jgi:hypothetical protein